MKRELRHFRPLPLTGKCAVRMFVLNVGIRVLNMNPGIKKDHTVPSQCVQNAAIVKNFKEDAMQLNHVLPALRNRWSANWKARHLSRRLAELAIQFLGYLVITILVLTVAAILILANVSSYLQMIGIQFLALIFICCLGIVTCRAFDTNGVQYLLHLISSDVERIAVNSGSLDIEALRQSVDELQERLRQS